MQKAELVGFIFSQTVQLIRIEFSDVMKQFELYVLLLLLGEWFVIKGTNCWFRDCIKQF